MFVMRDDTRCRLRLPYAFVRSRCRGPGLPPSTLDDVFSYKASQRILISHARHNAEVGMRVFAGILLISVCATPLSAQDTVRVAADSTFQQTEPLYRSPKRALILGSLIPGAGHIYAGEYVRGFLNYEATVGSIAEGVLVYLFSDKCMFDFLSTTPCKSGAQWPRQALGAGLVGLGAWMWVSTARDAPRAAERANERHRRAAQRAQPIIQPPADSHSRWRVGAEVHF